MGLKARPARGVDEALVERLRIIFGPRRDLVEKRMFGGLAFMVRGHMCVGIAKGNLMVRVGPDHYEDSLALPGARPMDFTGKPLRGFVYVGPAGYREQNSLRAWVDRGLRFVDSQPAK